MEQEKFYIDTMGNDDEAYREAMAFACKLAEENPTIKRVVLLIGQKGNDSWFERLFGRETVKDLYAGVGFKDCRPLFKFETVRTYKNGYGAPTDIVISCGLSSDDLFKIDDHDCVHSIIAIPWVKENTIEWIKTWKPQDIRNNSAELTTEKAVSCVVQKAMEDLTSSINMSTGIHHSADEEQAKTYILALHHHGELKDATELRGYLVRELGWDSNDAQDMYKLVDTLNSGRFFKGGSREKKVWKYYMDNWRKECAG